MAKESVGKKLKAIREKKGISHPDMETLSGVKGRTLQDVEYGATKQPGFETIAKMASALDVSLDELAGYKNSEAITRAHDVGAAIEILSKFEAAPPDIRNLVLSILYKDESFLRLSPKSFRQKAIDFLKAALPR